MINIITGFIKFRWLRAYSADIWFYSPYDKTEHTCYAQSYYELYHNILYLKRQHYKIVCVKYFYKPIDNRYDMY